MPPLVNISPPPSYKKQWPLSRSKERIEPVQQVGCSMAHYRSKSIPGASAPVRSCFEGTKKQKWGSWPQNGPPRHKEPNQFFANGSPSASQQSSDAGALLRRATSYSNVECRPDFKAPGTNDQGISGQIREPRTTCSENYPRTQHSNVERPGNLDSQYPVDHGNYGRSANCVPYTWEFGFSCPPAPGAVEPSGAWDQQGGDSSPRSVVSQASLSEEGETISIADKHTASTNVSISDFRLNPEAQSFDLVGESFKQYPQLTDLDISDDDNYAGFYLLSDPQEFYQAPQKSSQPQCAIEPSPSQPAGTIGNQYRLRDATKHEVASCDETVDANITGWAEEVELSLALTESEPELLRQSPDVCVLQEVVASVGLGGETGRDALVLPDEAATLPREKETTETASDSQFGSMEIGDCGIAIPTDRVISSEGDNEGTITGESQNDARKDTQRQDVQPQAPYNGQDSMGAEKTVMVEEQIALADEPAVAGEEQIVIGEEQITTKVEQTPIIVVWSASEGSADINRKGEILPSNEPIVPNEKFDGGEGEITLERDVALDGGEVTEDESKASLEKQVALKDKTTTTPEPSLAGTEVTPNGRITPDEKQITLEENQATAEEKQITPEGYSDESISQKLETKGTAAGTAFSYRDILLGNVSCGSPKTTTVSASDTIPAAESVPSTQATQTAYQRKLFLRPLPPDTSCDSLVKQIRGGMLEEIFISNFSTKSRIGQNGGHAEANDNVKKDDFAHVSFYSEEGARKFWDQMQGGLFEPGANSPNSRLKRGGDDTLRIMTFDDCRVMVSWRNRDQEPPPLAISEAVEKHGATRCLIVTFHKNKYIEGTARNLQGRPVASWNNDSPIDYREECINKLRGDMRSWSNGVQFQRIDALINEEADSPRVLILFLGISTAIAFKRYFENKSSYKGRCKVEFYGDECANLGEGTPPVEVIMNKSTTKEIPAQKAIPTSLGAAQNGNPPKTKKSKSKKKRQRAKKAGLSSN